MAKLTAPVKEVARILDLVPYLDAHPYSSISELAREFATTEKEITASLVALSLCGAPNMTPYDMIEVSYETGFVTLNQHDDLNTPRAFTPEESLALLLGLEVVREGIPASRVDLLTELDHLVLKLKGLAGDTVTHLASISSELSKDLTDAIHSRKRIEISYLSSIDSQPTSREISPLSVYEEDGHIYCEAFCHVANGFRTFRLDRIITIKPLESMADNSQQPQQVVEENFKGTAKLHSFKRENAEVLRVKRVDRRSKGSFQAHTKEWAVKAVVAAGGEVELLDPSTARGEINHLAAEILSLYADL